MLRSALHLSSLGISLMVLNATPAPAQQHLTFAILGWAATILLSYEANPGAGRYRDIASAILLLCVVLSAAEAPDALLSVASALQAGPFVFAAGTRPGHELWRSSTAGGSDAELGTTTFSQFLPERGPDVVRLQIVEVLRAEGFDDAQETVDGWYWRRPYRFLCPPLVVHLRPGDSGTTLSMSATLRLGSKEFEDTVLDGPFGFRPRGELNRIWPHLVSVVNRSP